MRTDFITDFSPIDRDLNFELRVLNCIPIVFWETNQKAPIVKTQVTRATLL